MHISHPNLSHSTPPSELALPGLLFHDVTPTKDYIHDFIFPWVHYIPVSSDLRDLKRKFDWAESHPAEAKKIANESTKLIEYLTSQEGFRNMFTREMVEPLKRVIEAYQPVSTLPTQSNDWREVAKQIEGADVLVPIVKCDGKSVHNCKRSGSKKQMRNVFIHHASNWSKWFIPSGAT